MRVGLLARVLALALVAPIARARASAHEYADVSLYPTANGAIALAGREGIFASTIALNRTTSRVSEAWLGPNPRVNDGRAYVRLDGIEFARGEATARASGGATGGADGLVEILMFERRATTNDVVGTWDERDGTRKFCCDEDLLSRGLCSRVNRAIARSGEGRDGDVGGTPSETSAFRAEVWFDGGDLVARSDVQAVSVDESGMYVLWFVVCDAQHAGVRVRGRTLWKNPSGYLPGAKTALLPFFGFATSAHLGLGFLWAIACATNWRYVLGLHNCITVVVGMSMTEMAAWYFDYSSFNATGYRSEFVTLVAVLLGSLRATLSRTLVLMVSMGYGVVRPTLGGISVKVVSLGICYLFSAAVKDVVEHVGAVDDLQPGAKLFLVLPVSAFDSVFVLWIFNSLSRTLTQLVLRKQTHKLRLYRAFTNVLAAAVAASIGWLAFETWFKSTEMIDKKWESAWMLHAFWHVLSFGLLAAICFLWRPDDGSARYAYSELSSDVSEDSWWSSALATDEEANAHRTPGKTPQSSKVMTSAKKTRAMHDFSLGDDDDDSARELETEMGKLE